MRKARKGSKQHLMSKLVHVDEFVVGTYEQGQALLYEPQANKNQAVVTKELSEKQQVKRAYIKTIDDYSAQSLTPNI